MARKKPTKKKSTDKKAAKKAAQKKASAAGKKSSQKKSPKKRPTRTKPLKKKPAASKTSKKKPARKKSAKKAVPRKKTARKTTRKAAPRRTRKAAPGGRRGKSFFEHFRRRLLEERERILTRLEDLRAELSGLQEMPRELEEWAQEEKDRDILIRLEEREATELRRIQAALERIDDGSYGKCQICGKPIPRDRLEELPTAFRCIDHTL